MNVTVEQAEATPEIQPVRVDGWALGFVHGQATARIRDVDLGERLGYERPRKIRDLIDRLVRDRKLNDIHHRPTVGRRTGQVAARPGKEYWLTLPEALKVAAKSETEPADALLDDMVRVFILAMQGRLPGRSEQRVDDAPPVATEALPAQRQALCTGILKHAAAAHRAGDLDGTRAAIAALSALLPEQTTPRLQPRRPRTPTHRGAGGIPGDPAVAPEAGEGIASRIRQILQKNNWTERELSRKAGLSETTVSKALVALKTDADGVVTRTLRAIAKAAGVSLAWVVEGERSEALPKQGPLTERPRPERGTKR